MADNSNQPGTSAGSSKNISITVSENDIKNYNQKIYGNVTIHQSTPSTHAPRRNPINNVERAVNTYIGRETELSDIKQLFHEYPVVVIAAMGGMGKTQLARKFASVNANVYRDRYWINAETEAQLLKSFDRLAKKVKVDANTDIDTVRDTYRSFTDGAALLIFDNVEHVNNVYEYLPTRIQLEDITLHVLITSRWTEWTSDSLVNCYQLEPLDISVSLQLFQKKFDETCINTMQKEWEELAELLGYLPLALQVAISYIYKRSKHNSDLPAVLADYMKQLKEGAAGLLNDPLTEYGNRSVYASMMLTLQQLENKADNVSNVQINVQWKFAVTIINTVAYIDPDEIEKMSLLELVDNHENICKLDEALEILTEYSLLNQEVDWIEHTIYSVHRIIQTSIRHNQTLMGTADKYYIRALKCAFIEYYFPWEVLQYANERASAVADYYKNNPSPTILEYLAENKAITAMEAVLRLISKNQIQIAMKEHDLLYHAVGSGDLSMTQLLWKYGADINQLCREGVGVPPLHLALESENVDIATWLLENGAAPTVRDMIGRNALHVAVEHETDMFGQTPLHVIYYSKNEEDILSTTCVLVDSGADMAAVDNYGSTVLHSASSSACAAAVSLILQRNKDLIHIKNEDGQTALHVIPYYNTRIDDERILSTIRILLERGGDLTKEDIQGNTVLHTAAKFARVEAVSLILQPNKDLINIVNKAGETALHVILYGDADINDKRILSTIRILLERGGDLTKENIQGNTVLHTAAKFARVVAVSLILQLNNDLINIVNEDGETALHVIPYYKYADEERILSTMRILLERGGDLAKEDMQGNTVLHSAAKGACVEAVSLILQPNKDLINIKNKDGKTALHVLGNSFNFKFAYIREERKKQLFAETARVLIMNGLSLDTRDNKGCTPLDTLKREVKDILLARPVNRQGTE